MKASERDDREYVWGLHPVEEAVASRPGRVDRVVVSREIRSSRFGRVLRAARVAGIPVSYVPRAVLERRAGRGAVHQGIAAVVSPIEYADPAAVAAAVCARPAALVVAIDRVEDPRNLGAVLRSAAAAGADAVLLAADATVGITPAAVKTSAGTAGRVPVAREAALGRRLRDLREHGFAIVGLDPRSEATWDGVSLVGPTVLVAGGEGRGPRPGVLRSCTARVAIPLAPGVDSLNVSVALGVVLFEAVRQRRAITGGARGRN